MNKMEKEECKKDYEKQRLEMSDEKCGCCPFVYECVFMQMEINDIVNGN